MFNILDYFRAEKRGSASLAKERLQIIVAHERRVSRGAEYIPVLQKEILEVVRKYVAIDEEQIKISMDKDGDYEILELNIALPDNAGDKPPHE